MLAGITLALGIVTWVVSAIHFPAFGYIVGFHFHLEDDMLRRNTDEE